jgi:hypothetical protein
MLTSYLHLTNCMQLTSWEAEVIQLVKKFSEFYGTLRSITMFTRVSYRILSWDAFTPSILTLSTPMSGDARQAMLLNHLWCWVKLAWWFPIYFGMFHLLTKFWTICKAVHLYIVSLQSFSVKTSLFYLWVSCFQGQKCKCVQFCWKNSDWATCKLGKKLEWRGLKIYT